MSCMQVLWLLCMTSDGFSFIIFVRVIHGLPSLHLSPFRDPYSHKLWHKCKKKAWYNTFFCGECSWRIHQACSALPSVNLYTKRTFISFPFVKRCKHFHCDYWSDYEYLGDGKFSLAFLWDVQTSSIWFSNSFIVVRNGYVGAGFLFLAKFSVVCINLHNNLWL